MYGPNQSSIDFAWINPMNFIILKIMKITFMFINVSGFFSICFKRENKK